MKKVLILLLLPLMAVSQQTREFSLATYNSLGYSPSNIDDRHPDFRAIINDLQPDILVMQEMSGFASAKMFLDSILNVDSATYHHASFIDGNDLDNALFYKTAKFDQAFTANHPTQLRDIFQYGIVPKGCKDTLHIFGVHLKASTGSTNEDRRADEIAVLRSVTDLFADSTNFLVCGDFNFYHSNEPAYINLLLDTPGDQGHFVDKITMTGLWNDSAYAAYHTQSPRTTQFNGGAHGGIDDRFDLILLSEALDASGGIAFIPGSMKVYGNDGLHYNRAITDAPAHPELDSTIITALHQASDHLPVLARFRYEYVSGVNLRETVIASEIALQYHQQNIILTNPRGRDLKLRIFSLSGQLQMLMHTRNSEVLNLEPGLYLIEVTDAASGERLLAQKVMQ